MSRSLSLGILISGGGRTMLNLADCIDAGTLDAHIAIVIASSTDIPGYARAQERDLPVVVPGAQGGPAYDDQVTSFLREHEVDLVCLCGYLRLVRIDSPFHDRIINIHPALLPRHGGQGMYGLAVHEAVLSSGDRESGCTVHVVDAEYDHGPVILQRRCPVQDGDDPQALADRVFAEECIAYPESLRMLASGQVSIRDGVLHHVLAGGGTSK